MFATSLPLLSKIQSYRVITSTHKYSAWYLGISISTPDGIKKYLSKVQVLSNVYLSTSAHALGLMPVNDSSEAV